MSEQAKILVADDQPYILMVLRQLLQKFGYANVVEVQNGAAALEALQADKIDLVLLDLEMPEMNGFEVLQKLKADMRLREIPVIMISSNEESEKVAECLDLGAEDYVRKPYNPTVLRARIASTLEKKRFRDQQAQFMRQVRDEKRRADELIHVVLPGTAASELRASGRVQPRRYHEVAVLFCDVVGFTSYCDSHEPEDVVSHLQTLFERFEHIADKHGLEKIKTIGDEFMAAAGMFRPNTMPLQAAVACALEMARAAPELEPGWKVRAGVNAGPLVAGIVGRNRYQFDIWGDTVNVAARMTSRASVGTVAMTYDAWMQVQHDFQGRMVGRIDIKGKGPTDIIEVYG